MGKLLLRDSLPRIPRMEQEIKINDGSYEEAYFKLPCNRALR
jgi:hypothetical protein